jgi:hypothetical protein
MKRSPLKRRTPLRKKSSSGSSAAKERIQSWLRAIVIQRDGGCVLRHIDPERCGGYRKDGKLILQADHLITRANSATYADSRLIVCICRNHHGWKSLGSNRNKAQYDALIREVLPPERIALWARAEAESWKPTRRYESDWKLEEAALKQEYQALLESTPQRGLQFLP